MRDAIDPFGGNIELFLLKLALLVATGYLASKKNRNVFGWVIFELAVPVLPFIIIASLEGKKSEGQKDSPNPYRPVNWSKVIIIVFTVIVVINIAIRIPFFRPDDPSSNVPAEAVAVGELPESKNPTEGLREERLGDRSAKTKSGTEGDLLNKAEQGSPEAQFRLGRLFFTGRTKNAEPDYGKAWSWFEKAATQGHTEAQVALGMMWLEDLYRGMYLRDVLFFLKQAGDKGHPIALYYLGRVYQDATGSRSDGTALKLFIVSAKQGYAPAMYRLALMMRKGLEVPQDISGSLLMMKKAAKQGSAEAQFYLGREYQHGGDVEQNIEEAVVWYEKAGQRRDRRIRSYLNTVTGLVGGKDVDLTEDVDIHERYIAGHAQAQYNLGLLYRDGLGVDQSYAKADGWFRKAAVQGHAQAQYDLGMLYLEGRGVSKDREQALHWLRKAAGQGHGRALAQLREVE